MEFCVRFTMDPPTRSGHPRMNNNNNNNNNNNMNILIILIIVRRVSNISLKTIEHHIFSITVLIYTTTYSYIIYYYIMIHLQIRRKISSFRFPDQRISLSESREPDLSRERGFGPRTKNTSKCIFRFVIPQT